MNKAELIEAIAKETNLTKADSKRALDAFLKPFAFTVNYSNGKYTGAEALCQVIL